MTAGWESLAEIAASVRSGRVTAVAMAERALAAIRERDGALLAVTRVLADRAMVDARRVDAQVAKGIDPGALAGVPFGVKDLFDVAGVTTTAGSRLRRNDPPAAEDAEAVRRLCAAGAVLVATLNMDEFAYGFATINAHHGTTRNPHDTNRLAGGSSGGSAAAVAGGLLPLTLGSDTNGSIRVPSALCGIYGLKPTHGALPMGGTAPFVDSFDDIGPFTRSVEDLRIVQEVLAGRALPAGEALRIGRLTGWFTRNVARELVEAIDAVAHVLGAPAVDIPHVAAARSAAFLMTAAEGGALHLPDLRHRALDYDPATRDRLIAGALLPASAYWEAERFRRGFRAIVAGIFERFDVLIAPSVGVVAPPIDAPTMEVDGVPVPARAQLGLHTQPISFIGLPVIAAPLARPGKLPLGLQLIGAPGAEAKLFALAARMERDGLIAATAVPAIRATAA